MHSIGQVYFINAQVGWMTYGKEDIDGGNHQSVLRKTVDGGETWTDIFTKKFDEGPKEPSAREMRFLNETKGWRFQPGLFSTTDGGVTWTNNGFGTMTDVVHAGSKGNDILSLEIVGETAWVIKRDCQPEADCTFSILKQEPTGEWLPLEQQPDLCGIEVNLFSDKKGDVFVFGEEGAHFSERCLWVTSNQGKTWNSVSLPDVIGVIDPIMAASPDGDLWYFERGVPATAQTAKILYVSYDNGETWLVKSDAGFTSFHQRIGSLPISGYPCGLTVVTSDEAYLGIASWGGMMRTTNGGVNRELAVPYDLNIQIAVGGRCAPFFLDENNGWIWIADYLFHTLDGGETWSVVEVLG